MVCISERLPDFADSMKAKAKSSAPGSGIAEVGAREWITKVIDEAAIGKILYVPLQAHGDSLAAQ